MFTSYFSHYISPAISKFMARRDLIGPSSTYMRNGCLHFEVTVLHSVFPAPDFGTVAPHLPSCPCTSTPSRPSGPLYRRSVWQPTPVLQPPQQQQQQQQLQLPPSNTPVPPAVSETPTLPHPNAHVLGVAALSFGN